MSVNPSAISFEDSGARAATADAVFTARDADFVVDLTKAPGPSRRAVRRREIAIALYTVLVDVSAVVAGYLVAKALRVDRAIDQVNPLDYGRMFLTVPLWILIFAAHDLYDRRRLAAPSEEARRLLAAVSASVVAVVVVTFIAGIEVSRAWLACMAAATLGFVAIGRFAIRSLVSFMRRRGILFTKAIVVGTNEEGRTIARSLRRERGLGYNVIGFVNVEPGGFATVDNCPVLGTVDQLGEIVRQSEATAVVVAGTALGADRLVALDRSLQPLDVEVRISPGLPHIAATRITVNPLDGVALLTLEKNEFTRRQAIAKRAFDIVGATVALVLAAPLFVLIAVAVLVTCGRPVVFRQRRVGQSGVLYTLFKFRTMCSDAEQRRADLEEANEATGLLFKLKDDPRVTRVGRHLRPWGLDELPQLFNVLRGNMSLVGPRPALPDEVALYDDRLRERLRVKPGLTGLWQVKGRHELSFDDYVRYDLFYVENWSLGFDLYVIAKTIPALLARRGSY